MARLDHVTSSIATDVSASLVVRGASFVLRAILALLFARLLGVSEAGVYFTIIAVTGLFALGGRLGGDRLALSETSRAPEAARAITSAALRRAIPTSVVLAIAAALVAMLIGQYSAAVAFGVAAIVPANIAWIAAGSLRGVGQIASSIACAELITPLVQVLTFLVIGEWSADSALASFFIGACIAAFVTMVLLRRATSPTPAGIELSATDSMAMLTVAVNGQLRQSFPALAASLLGGPAAAGAMGAAFRLDRAVLVPTEAIRLAVAPRLTSEGPLDANTHHLAVRTARWAAAFHLPLAIAMFVFAPTILSWLGEGFDAGAPWLRLMIIGSAANAISGSTFQTLLVSDFRTRLARTSTLGSIALLATFGLLALIVDIDAVAIAMLVSFVAVAVLEWTVARDVLRARLDIFAPAQPAP